MSNLRGHFRNGFSAALDEVAFKPHSGWIDLAEVLRAAGHDPSSPEKLNQFMELLQSKLRVTVGRSESGYIIRWSDAFKIIEFSKTGGFEKAIAFVEGSLDIGTSDESRSTRLKSPQFLSTILTPYQIRQADIALSTCMVLGGSYIELSGYNYFNVLTQFQLSGGDSVFFASKDEPFCDSMKSMGGYSPATLRCREITGYSKDLSDTSPGFLEAGRMLTENRSRFPI